MQTRHAAARTPAPVHLDRVAQHCSGLAADLRPGQRRSCSSGSFTGLLQRLGLHKQLGQGIGKRLRLPEGHEAARAVAQQILRVSIGRGHGRLSRRDRERERARHDLVAVPVRGAEHVGRREQAREIVEVEEAVEEDDVVLEVELAHEPLQALPILLAFGPHDLGMGAPRDHIRHVRHQVADPRHCLERDLDPLARREQAERRDDGTTVDPERCLCSCRRARRVQLGGGAMWHHPELARAHEMLFEDHPSRRRGEDHDRGSAITDLPHDAGLVRRWTWQHGVQRDDEGHFERVDEIEDHLSVGSAEDAELVLEQDRVEAIGDDGSFPVRSHVVMPDDCHDVRPEVLRVCHDCRDTGTFEASSARE